MTADDASLDALLKQRYLTELSIALWKFSHALGLTATDGLANLDAVSRLFVRYESFPAYSAWRKETLREEIADLGEVEGKETRAVSPGAARLRAVQIKGGERTTREEWDRLVKAFSGRRLKGDDHKWNLTEDELAEALG